MTEGTLFEIFIALLFVDLILALAVIIKLKLKKPNKLKKAQQKLLISVSELNNEKEMLIKEIVELEEQIDTKNLAFKKLFGGETQ